MPPRSSRTLRLSIVFALAVVAACSSASDRVADGRPGHPSTSPTTVESEPSPALDPAPTTARAFAWVAIEDDGAVAQVDLAQRRVVRRYEGLGGGPHNLAVAPDGTVVVALPRSGRIALIRGDSARQVQLGGSPHDVKVRQSTVVVANEGAARLDLVSLDGERTGEVRLRANPHDVAVSLDGRSAFASLNGTDELAVVDLQERTVSRYVPTGRRPHDLLFSPDGRLWVTDWSGHVNVFSADLRLVGTVPGVEAHHLAFSPAGDRAWITDHGAGRVLVVDNDTLEIRSSVALGGAPHHVAVTADGSQAVVADHDSGTLVVFDAVTAQKVAAIPVGRGPHGVGVAPG